MAEAAPDRLVDAAGREHSPAEGEFRIVSLVPSLTELLLTLGLGHRVVGRSRYCIRPRGRVEQIPTVGGTKTVDLEEVRRLDPTHVILNVDENRRETADALAEFVPHPVVTHPLAPEDNPSLYRFFGELFGAEERARELSSAFTRVLRELRRLSAALPERKVLYLIWRKPWMTVGPETYVSRTLALVGWRTVGGDEAARYPRVETWPTGCELVLFSSEPFPFREAHRREFGEQFGVPSERLLPIDGQIASWYGNRAIGGLHELGELALAVERRLSGSATAQLATESR